MSVPEDVKTSRPPSRQRNTKQLQLVRKALSGEADFCSAAEIFDKLHRQGQSVGMATIYRNLAALADSGEIDQLRAQDGTMLFRQCEPHHHHHLRCHSCGLTEEVRTQSLEKTLQLLAAQHGFTQINHVVELSGLCAKCSSQQP